MRDSKQPLARLLQALPMVRHAGSPMLFAITGEDLLLCNLCGTVRKALIRMFSDVC